MLSKKEKQLIEAVLNENANLQAASNAYANAVASSGNIFNQHAAFAQAAKKTSQHFRDKGDKELAEFYERVFEQHNRRAANAVSSKKY